MGAIHEHAKFHKSNYRRPAGNEWFFVEGCDYSDIALRANWVKEEKESEPAEEEGDKAVGEAESEST